ncbi:MAG: 4Fe-4S dicluster domain-containing protein [Desulfobacterales bacterium]
MISIRLKKGYSLKIAGAPSTALSVLPAPARVAAVPNHLPFVKPRLKVKVDDLVALGTVLFEDKRNPDVKFLSPGGGRVTAIHFGERRVIREIIIDLAPDETRVNFETLSAAELETVQRARLVALLLTGGLWPLLRALPFRDMPRPDVLPPAVYVQVGSTEPFQPQPSVYLQGNEERFRFGLALLDRLAEGRVFVAAPAADAGVLKTLGDLVTHTYAGNYPAHDPGVLVYRTRTEPAANRSWYIDAQDVLLLAELLQTGRYPTARTVVLAGSQAESPQHFKTRLGVPLADLAAGRTRPGDTRFVSGGILTGHAATAEGYLGLLEKALHLLPEGHEKGPFLGFVRPGFKRPSYSRAFLSAFNPAELTMDCNRNGGLRACIACNYCPDACPVEILPQLTYKSILVEEVEEYLAHGLLDCVECGLCSYVCPSKIELLETLKSAKASYYRDQG